MGKALPIRATAKHQLAMACMICHGVRHSVLAISLQQRQNLVTLKSRDEHMIPTSPARLLSSERNQPVFFKSIWFSVCMDSAWHGN